MAVDDKTPAEMLAAFIDHLKRQGVRTYKGEVPLTDGPVSAIERVPIDITFERPERRGPGDMSDV